MPNLILCLLLTLRYIVVATLLYICFQSLFASFVKQDITFHQKIFKNMLQDGKEPPKKCFLSLNKIYFQA